MPQFSELEDTITVELKEIQQGCEMTFTQVIHVAQEENWTESDIEKALGEIMTALNMAGILCLWGLRN